MNGALAGQLRDVAYQATTTDFWGALRALGGPQTYHLGGALNCGKGQPGQMAPVSPGCPGALFEDSGGLNTEPEGNQPGPRSCVRSRSSHRRWRSHVPTAPSCSSTSR